MYWTVFIVSAVLVLAYCLLILVYRSWYFRLSYFRVPGGVVPRSGFTVIIPARDEEDYIGRCLQSVLSQSYPPHLLEVIVINDHSTDGTEAIVRGLQARHTNLRLMNLSDMVGDDELNSYKKKALELAIAQASHGWVVTTDADCEAGADWLRCLDAYIQTSDAVLVAGPVMFTNDGSFLSVFQLLDFISLQGITAAAVGAGHHAMCNGANLAYRKDAFDRVNGFRGIDQIASGDDMLLMHKIGEAYPGRLGYLFSRDAIVRTPPMPDWKRFINQRIRWASKADKYRDKSITWVLALVYAVNVALLVLLVISTLTENGFINWLLVVVAKTLVELSFMVPAARFFRQVSALVWFPLMQPIHMVYTVMAGWLGKFGSYQWKGRKVK